MLSDKHKNKAISLYVCGVEIIFCVTGDSGTNLMSATEDSNDYMISVNIDQSSQ